jgi:purine-binding chemotaxis protein CheW
MESTKENTVLSADQKKAGTIQIIVFKQGDEEYALHIDQIKEVVITPSITRMPQTPGFIKGVANIRGNIIAIIDLEEKFNLKRSDERTENNYTLVVESEDFKMGLLVREVPNTLTIAASSFDESVSIINDGNTENTYIKGVVKYEKRLIILIDIFKVIDQELVSNFKKTVAA